MKRHNGKTNKVFPLCRFISNLSFRSSLCPFWSGAFCDRTYKANTSTYKLGRRPARVDCCTGCPKKTGFLPFLGKFFEKNFFLKFFFNDLYGGNFMREIDSAHSRILKMLP